MDETELTNHYDCPHCKGKHTHRYDLKDLGQQATSITGADFREFKFNSETVRVRCLTGDAVEDLEAFRAQLYTDTTSPEQERHNRAVLAKIRFRHMLFSVDFPQDLETDIGRRFVNREQKLAGLTYSQYAKFERQVLGLQQDMQHGLPLFYDEETAELLLIIGDAPCPNKKGESTQLSTRFQDFASIPMV